MLCSSSDSLTTSSITPKAHPTIAYPALASRSKEEDRTAAALETTADATLYASRSTLLAVVPAANPSRHDSPRQRVRRRCLDFHRRRDSPRRLSLAQSDCRRDSLPRLRSAVLLVYQTCKSRLQIQVVCRIGTGFYILRCFIWMLTPSSHLKTVAGGVEKHTLLPFLQLRILYLP